MAHDKRILLWEALLRQDDYDDLGVVDFLKQGVPLVGTSDCPAYFEKRVRPAVLTEAKLRAAAPDLCQGMKSRSLNQEPEHMAHLLEATKEELDAGFIKGPLTEEQVTAEFGLVIRIGWPSVASSSSKGRNSGPLRTAAKPI